MNKNKILSGGGKNLIGGGKWGRRGREVGEKGEGSGGKGGGNWEWGTPLSTPSNKSYGSFQNALSSIHRVITFYIIFQSFFCFLMAC